MDGQRFDDLTRALATSASRRRVLMTLAGSLLGGLGAALAGHPSRVAAACVTDDDCPPPTQQCRTVRCSGGTCQTLPRTSGPCNDGNPCTHPDACNSIGVCVGQFRPDGSECGLGFSCGSQVCIDGTCTTVAFEPGTPCNDGNACTEGTACNGFPGGCVGGTPVDCDDANPCTTDSCDPGSGCAHAAVADGTPCGGAGACASGQCVCPSAKQTYCPGADVCVNLKKSEDHCGACDAPCDPGKTCCRGRCVNTKTSERHCGRCGHPCGLGQVCRNGACRG